MAIPLHKISIGRRAPVAPRVARRAIPRFRFQLAGGFLLAVLLPAFMRWDMELLQLPSPVIRNSVFGTALAFAAGAYFHRKLTILPGVKASLYIAPTAVAVYGISIFLFFFLRLDYSRFQVGASFILSIAWHYCLYATIGRLKPLCLAVLPGGDVGGLRAAGNIIWRQLDRPAGIDADWHGLVVDRRADLPAAWERFISDCALAGIPVFHVKDVRESLTGRVEIEHISENTLGSLDPNQAYLQLKQAIDRAAALAAVILLSPLFAVTALLIRLDSPGPAIFRQERTGYRGRVFTVYKFRTMVAATPGADTRRDSVMTKDGDRRVTRPGRFLRKTRLDELPQILNILRGEMSWIGPRPEAVPLSQWYEENLPFYRYRHIVRPGITGWAQVRQGHVVGVDDVRAKLHYDFYYIKNFSVWLDALIVLRTVRTMICGFGAR